MVACLVLVAFTVSRLPKGVHISSLPFLPVPLVFVSADSWIQFTLLLTLVLPILSWTVRKKVELQDVVGSRLAKSPKPQPPPGIPSAAILSI